MPPCPGLLAGLERRLFVTGGIEIMIQEDGGWQKVATFAAQYEADLAVARLEAAGIPVLVKGPTAGIFGPGQMGPTALGVTVFVPADQLRRAKEVLE